MSYATAAATTTATAAAAAEAPPSPSPSSPSSPSPSSSSPIITMAAAAPAAAAAGPPVRPRLGGVSWFQNFVRTEDNGTIEVYSLPKGSRACRVGRGMTWYRWPWSEKPSYVDESGGDGGYY
ncbi:hypothetical protein F4680DRAFT_447043 [Xylaria scruposa]|nr:hypothetical protein F4680DRAFT_447043 [Xylaria scruposa]